MRTLFSLFILTIVYANAQCDGRYQEEIFSTIDVSTVTYSDINDLQLDIYQPVGDIESDRPLIILAHGGSFIAGVRTNPSMVSLGQNFAKKGYVVASITYRLMSFLDLLSAPGALNGVARAIGDGKAAIRYFRKTIEEGNPYNIDNDQIYFGGNSAGAIMAIHIGFMDEVDITDPDLIEVIENNGGIEGNSGNQGYSSEVRGVISLAGAIADIDFIEESDFDKILISCHGNQDGTVPYMCGQPLGIPVLPELCGGGTIQDHSNEIGFNNLHHLLFEGEDHVPWEYGGPAEELMLNFVTEKLYKNLDCSNLEIQTSNEKKTILFPNPIKENLHISHSDNIIQIRIQNINGQILLNNRNTNNISLKGIPSGIYFIHFKDVNQNLFHYKVIKH